MNQVQKDNQARGGVKDQWVHGEKLDHLDSELKEIKVDLELI